VIGTLTLLIAGLAAGEMSTARAESALDPQEYFELEGEIEAARPRIDELEELIAQADALAEELERARTELEELEAKRAELVAEDADRVARAEARTLSLLAEKNRLEEELEAARARIAELKERLARLLAEKERLDLEAEPDALLLTGGGSGEGLVPTFVECTAEGLRLSSEKTDDEQVVVASDRIAQSAELVRYLRGVKRTDGAIAIFLLRPGGVSAYDSAAVVARRLDAPYGHMAVPGQELLDYSLFLEPNGNEDEED